jgi:hypothetical protein
MFFQGYVRNVFSGICKECLLKEVQGMFFREAQGIFIQGIVGNVNSGVCRECFFREV